MEPVQLHTEVRTISPRRRYRFRESRPNDYLYDPAYVLACRRDYCRCEFEAQVRQRDVQLRPNFRSMFSDHPRYPRLEAAARPADPLPPFVDRTWVGKHRASTEQPPVDVRGQDRHKFFRRPVPAYVTPVLPPERFQRLPPPPGRHWCRPAGANRPRQQFGPFGPLPEGGKPHALCGGGAPCAWAAAGSERERSPCEMRTHGTQTDYREADTQTTPWDTPFSVREGDSPEVLTIAALSWSNGLPAGLREVDLIERMRVRRAWEASLPPADEPGAEAKRQRILAALERDEWAYREREIGSIQELRMQIAESLLKAHQSAAEKRSQDLLRRAWARRRQERDRKLGHIRRAKDRQLRMLDMAHRGLPRRYKRPGVLEETLDHASELYGPIARHGVDPRRRHEKLHASLAPKDLLCGLELVENLPDTPRPSFDFDRQAKPRPERLLCVRETRWTEEGLASLLEELRLLRKQSRGGSSLGLVQRVSLPETPPATPTLDVVEDDEEMLYQDSVLLQKVIKGRAVQCLMFQGLERCRELIAELKSTHALSSEAMQCMHDMQHRVLANQREAAHYEREERRLEGLAKQIEGMAISSMLDFLNKELSRLQDERRVHALVMLAERARSNREADEAGRRQAEERRRREHDEIFKQTMKVHQDTVEVYLESVIAESLGWAADERAHELVREMVASIDQAAEEARTRADAIEEQELVADLLQSFLLPEVQKRALQERHQRRQQRFLRAAHDEVFGRALAARPGGAHPPHPPPPPPPPHLICFPDFKYIEPIAEQASVIARELEQSKDEEYRGFETPRTASSASSARSSPGSVEETKGESLVGILERAFRTTGSILSSDERSKDRSKEPSQASFKEPSVESPSAKSPSPKSPSPKSPSPKSQSPKSPSPKSQSPKSPSPKSQSPKSQSPKSQSPKSQSPKSQSPKSQSPKSQSQKSPTGSGEDDDGALPADILAMLRAKAAEAGVGSGSDD